MGTFFGFKKSQPPRAIAMGVVFDAMEWLE